MSGTQLILNDLSMQKDSGTFIHALKFQFFHFKLGITLLEGEGVNSGLNFALLVALAWTKKAKC